MFTQDAKKEKFWIPFSQTQLKTEDPRAWRGQHLCR